MEKENNNAAMFGGCLGLVAFILPWVGVAFIVGSPLLGAVISDWPAPGSLLILIEPIAALLLLVFGVLGESLGRTATYFTLAGSGLGIIFVLYTFIAEVGLAFSTNSGFDKFGGILFLGVGFWVAVVGFTMGMNGSIRALKR